MSKKKEQPASLFAGAQAEAEAFEKGEKEKTFDLWLRVAKDLERKEMDVEGLLEIIDKDSSGTVKYDKFSAGVKELSTSFGYAELKAMFRDVDPSDRGSVSRDVSEPRPFAPA